MSRNSTIATIILIKSDSVGKIDAKLKLYKKYKHLIDTGDIFLHHVYEDFDEAAKLIANRKILLCCQFVDQMKSKIENFLAREQTSMVGLNPTHQTHDPLHMVIERSIETTLTRKKVRDICYGLSIGKARSAAYNEYYLCHSTFTVREIKQSLVRETLIKIAKTLGKEISDKVLLHMETVVQNKLLRELGHRRFQISDDIYHRIEYTLIGRIIEMLETVGGWIVTIATFIINFFSPVDVNSFGWRAQVADEIYSKVYDKKDSIKDFAFKEILCIWKEAITDLKDIAANLDDFRTKTIPQDQNTRK